MNLTHGEEKGCSCKVCKWLDAATDIYDEGDTAMLLLKDVVSSEARSTEFVGTIQALIIVAGCLDRPFPESIDELLQILANVRQETIERGSFPFKKAKGK